MIQDLPRLLLILPLAVFAQPAAPFHELPTFQLPANMTETPSDLREVVGHPSMLQAIRSHFHCTSCPNIRATFASLGVLGSGAILSEVSPDSCGATGNCSILVLVQERGSFRIQEIDSGWAYSVVTDEQAVPSILVETNLLCCSGVVNRYSYLNSKFVRTGCDWVELKQEGGDIQDPRQVNVRPCGSP